MVTSTPLEWFQPRHRRVHEPKWVSTPCEPKPPAAPQRAPGKSQKKAAASAKTAAAKPTTPSLVVPTQNPTSPLEDIVDLLDHLSHHECVELTRRLLTSVSSLPKGAARSRAVLKIVILFIAEYGSTPQED